MLERETELPIDLMFGKPPGETEGTDVLEYVVSLRQKIESAHEFARKHLSKSAIRQKRNYDRGVSEQCFKQGDAVWLYTPTKKKGLTPKLQRYWTGPYVVVKCLSDTVYRIQKGPHTKAKVVHRNRLSAYHGKKKVEWLEKDIDTESSSLGNIPFPGSGRKGNVCPNKDLDNPPQLTNTKQRPKRVSKPPMRYGDWGT